MSYYCIENQNKFQGYSRVSIKRLPHVVFFAQSFNIPGVSLGVSTQATPLRVINLIGNQLTYNDFYITFVIDENLNNYMEIFNWIHGIGKPETTQQYVDIEDSMDGKYSDIAISIMTNKRNPNKRLTLTNSFPYNISDLVLDNAGPDRTSDYRYSFF